MDTDLQVKEESTGLVLPEESQVLGTDTLGRDDLAIPRLILVQSQHQDLPDHMQHVGLYYNTTTGEYKPVVSAVMLGIAKQRVAFPRDFSRDSKALCGSDDAIMPRDEYKGNTVADTKLNEDVFIGQQCGACPLSQFSADGISPMCALSYNYGMIDADSGIPFVFRAQRTGLSAARQLNTIAKMIGRGKIVQLMSKEVNSDAGNYFVPMFSIGDKVTPDLMEFANSMAADYGNVASRFQPDAEFEASEKPTEEDEISF